MKYIAIALMVLLMAGNVSAMNVTDDYKAGVREGLALAALQAMYPEIYNATLAEIFGNATIAQPAPAPAIEKVSGTVAPVHKIDGTQIILPANRRDVEQGQIDSKFASFLAN